MTDTTPKPRIALMGEFSAGKSTLTNLLLGSRPLPVRVTATRLPPVWISYGAERAEVVAPDGCTAEIALDALDSVPLEQARRINLFLPCEALELCDLIDMPGISDPNMPADVWQAVLPEVDSVIWCTPATQAWRQSEAAFWSILAPELRAPGVLLVTHFDKLTSERDGARVLRRVTREAGEAFGAVFPIALPLALSAGEDMDAWKTSGADQFVEHLIDLLLHWEDRSRPRAVASDPDAPADAPQGLAELSPAPNLVRKRLHTIECASSEIPAGASPQSDDATLRVQPRRVRPVPQAKSPRPRRARLERNAK